jgi:mannosyltransferase
LAAYALLAFAALLRIPGVFSAPFWSDEYFSWLTATQPSFVQFFLRCVGVDVYPPLSYLPVWLIAKISDASWALRLPSALAGLACAWVALRMLRRYMKEGQALALAALVALMPLSVYLGWESKAYNVFALFNLLMLEEALLLGEQPLRSWKRLALWVALSMWSFFLSPYFVAAMLLGALAAYGRANPAMRKVWKGSWVGMLWALPLAPFFVKTLLLYAGSSAYNTDLAMAPLYSLENFSCGFWMAPPQQLAMLLVFALAVAAAIQSPAPRPLKAILAATAFLPPLLFAMVSALGKPNYNDRAMLVSGFAWVLLAGLGAASLRPLLAKALLAALLLAQATALLQYHAAPELQRVDYHRAWNEVVEQWQEGDVVMHGYFESGLPFKYYAARETAQGLRSQPRPNYIHQESAPFTQNSAAQGIRGMWRRVNAWLSGRGMGVYAGLDPAFVDGDSLEDAIKGARRVWLVVASDEAVRRQMMPIPNGFRGGQKVGRYFDFAKEGWLKGKYRFVSQGGDDEVRLYLYRRL